MALVGCGIVGGGVGREVGVGTTGVDEMVAAEVVGGTTYGVEAGVSVVGRTVGGAGTIGVGEVVELV